MNKNVTNITNTFKEISKTPVWDKDIPITMEEYEALLNVENTEALIQLLTQEDKQAMRDVTLTDMMKMPFGQVQIVIGKFSLAKRIKILEELDDFKTYLYNQAARYGGNEPAAEGLSVKDWRTIMGKLKHLEILQAWLYGIN